jgi:hypothetical protein
MGVLRKMINYIEVNALVASGFTIMTTLGSMIMITLLWLINASNFNTTVSAKKTIILMVELTIASIVMYIYVNGATTGTFVLGFNIMIASLPIQTALGMVKSAPVHSLGRRLWMSFYDTLMHIALGLMITGIISTMFNGGEPYVLSGIFLTSLFLINFYGGLSNLHNEITYLLLEG